MKTETSRFAEITKGWNSPATRVTGLTITSFGEIISSSSFSRHPAKDTAKNNAMSKEEFVKAVFKASFEEDGVTSEELCFGTQSFRGEATVILVARLIKLTNAFCKSRLNNITISDGRKNSRRSKWVASTDKSWISFLQVTKTDDFLKQIPNGIIDTV